MKSLFARWPLEKFIGPGPGPKLMPPARRATKEAIRKLVKGKEWEEEIERIFRKGPNEDEAQELLKWLKEEARPRLPAVAMEQVQELHRQSARRLREEQWRKIAEHNRRQVERQRAEWVEATRPDPQQAAIDFWVEQKLAAAEAERQFRESLDPFNTGLYGPGPCHRD